MVQILLSLPSEHSSFFTQKPYQISAKQPRSLDDESRVFIDDTRFDTLLCANCGISGNFPGISLAQQNIGWLSKGRSIKTIDSQYRLKEIIYNFATN